VKFLDCHFVHNTLYISLNGFDGSNRSNPLKTDQIIIIITIIMRRRRRRRSCSGRHQIYYWVSGTKFNILKALRLGAVCPDS
jgi:hypothetical protein